MLALVFFWHCFQHSECMCLEFIDGLYLALSWSTLPKVGNARDTPHANQTSQLGQLSRVTYSQLIKPTESSHPKFFAGTTKLQTPGRKISSTEKIEHLHTFTRHSAFDHTTRTSNLQNEIV